MKITVDLDSVQLESLIRTVQQDIEFHDCAALEPCCCFSCQETSKWHKGEADNLRNVLVKIRTA